MYDREAFPCLPGEGTAGKAHTSPSRVSSTRGVMAPCRLSKTEPRTHTDKIEAKCPGQKCDGLLNALARESQIYLINGRCEI